MVRRTLCALALVACTPAPVPPSAPPGSASGAALDPTAAAGEAPGGDTGDSAAARALYDQAVLLHLAGDELGWQAGLLRVAQAHPETPHGRAAARRLSSGGGQGVVAAGVLSAVAIPAFMKYIRRSKTSEATVNLRRMVNGAVAFHQEEHADPAGRVLPRRFPQTTPLTPNEPFPCDGGSKKYAPRPESWAVPGWQELSFAMDDPHLYRYEFVADGEGATARFTARAVGDLDCDGVLSTFEWVGSVGADGEVVTRPVASGSDELE